MWRLSLPTRIALLFLAVATLVEGCATSAPQPPKHVSYTSRDMQLWTSTIEPYLEQPLWLENESYDAGHYLMVPLHAAFQAEDPTWRKQFHTHFASYSEHIPELSYANRLNELQYLYLASNYIALCSSTGEGDRLPAGLREHVLSRVIDIWTTDPANTWGHEPFIGVRERLRYKLSLDAPGHSYYRAIVDEDLFLFGISAALKQSLRAEDATVPAEVNEILESAQQVFTDEVRWSNGTWLFQPGVWTDYPDYAHAGHSVVDTATAPERVQDVAPDTSHSHRLPRVLRDLLEASDSPGEAQIYSSLLSGLDRRMTDIVLVPPDTNFKAWRTTNYMDGHNGYYRWEYATQGANNGYAPYELSGTLNLGWWGFLESKSIRRVYRDQSRAFPLPENVLDTYVGPNTTRVRNELVELPDCYTNGMMELIVRLAATL